MGSLLSSSESNPPRPYFMLHILTLGGVLFAFLCMTASGAIAKPKPPPSSSRDLARDLAKPAPERFERDQASEVAPRVMVRIDPKEVAFVIVYAAFKHTEVRVNGRFHPPQNTKQGKLVIVQVRGGADIHTVEVKDTESESVKTYHIRLAPGESRAFMVNLAKSTAGKGRTSPNTSKKKNDKGKVGFLTINSRPTGEVYIDGKVVAEKTPLRRYEVSPGSHVIRILYSDSKEFSETRRASISKGRHVTLNFKLKTKK